MSESLKDILKSFSSQYSHIYQEVSEKKARLGTEGFGTLTKYGIIGQLLSVGIGFAGDKWFKFGNPFLESTIRIIGGEGENIPYFYFFLRQRKKRQPRKTINRDARMRVRSSSLV